MTTLFAPAFKSVAAFTARDYQALGIDNAFDLWGNGCPGAIFRQPTGSGKTVSGSLIAERWLARGDNYYVMVCTHERNLVQQFAEEIEDVISLQPGIEMASQRVDANALPRVTVACRATLHDKKSGGEAGKRLRKFDNKLNWLLIIDECHRWAWKLPSCAPILNWFDANPESRRLGLTATPERTDRTSLQKIFPGIASDYRLFDAGDGRCAVDDGWAVAYDQRFITVDGVDFKNLREVSGDFDKEELGLILSERETLLKLIKPTLDLVGERRTIIFNPTVGMAKAVAAAINAETQSTLAESLDGTVTDGLRRDCYRRHKRGDFQFLSVCGLCREGYNDPGIQAVAVFRPTKSRPLAEQMKGRGCRPWKGLVDGLATPQERKDAIAASPKPNCMIVDLVGVTGLADCASTASILAAGLEDEKAIIDLANAAAQENSDKGESTDMMEEVRKARRQIEEERARAKQKRLEQAERDRERAERMAKIRGEVTYSERHVQQGHGQRSYRDPQGTATINQRAKLLQLGVPENHVERHFTTVAAAGAMIGKLLDRHQKKLCTYKQGMFLKKRGYDPREMTKADATTTIEGIKRGWKVKAS